MAIDLSEVAVTAEVVVIVENLITLREEVLLYIRWLNKGEEMFPPSFIVLDLD